MKVLQINGEYMRTKKSMYTHLIRVFSFPSYFGNNLDALWDQLNEENEPTVIKVLNTNVILEDLGSYGEQLIRLLKKLEEENRNYTIHFK